MAGDWIKIEISTPDKPEVAIIADALKIDPDAVVGKLFRIWIWADLNSVDGNGVPVADAFLDRIAHRKGFAAAMRKAGWLVGDAGALCFPGFDRHNGRTAKERASTNRRVAKHRKSNKMETVQPLQKPLPEKRREEKNTPAECTPFSPAGEEINLLDIVHAYPRRQDDAEALEHVAKSIAKGASAAEILAGTRAIAAIIPRLPSGHLNAFVVGAGSFFRREKWRDDPQTWLRLAAGKNGAQIGTLNLGGRKEEPWPEKF